MGKKYGNYHLQCLFDDLHVIYMFFTYYVNFQLFQCLFKWEWRKLYARIKNGPEEIYHRFLEYVNAKVCFSHYHKAQYL